MWGVLHCRLSNRFLINDMERGSFTQTTIIDDQISRVCRLGSRLGVPLQLWKLMVLLANRFASPDNRTGRGGSLSSSVVVSSAPKIAAIALRQVCESRSISARSLLEDHRVGFGFLDPVFQG